MPASAREHVVVGAGVSGLWAALLLSRAGERVRVVERASRIGGLAAAETFRGLPCDLGSHRIHPAALERSLFSEIQRSEPMLSRPRRGVLLLGGRRVPYPPDAPSMLRALGPRVAASASLHLLRRARRKAFARWDADRRLDGADPDVGFERFVVDRVGRLAYEAFYRPYAEKVWGLPPAELSQSVAKKRVSTAAPWRALRAFARPGRGERFAYPPGGTASIVAWLEARLRECGVGVETGVTTPPPVTGGGRTLFSGSVRDLVATRLEHRGLHLVWLAFGTQRLGDAETYYSPERRWWFGRVSELSGYSPDLARRGETIVCVEIPEGTWGPTRDFGSPEAVATIVDQLRDAGILRQRVQLLEARHRFVPDVYPLYRIGWRDEWGRAMAAIAERADVVPFGRQGLFLHVNLDHCADLAELAVAHVLAGRDSTSWIPVAERALGWTVRD